MIGSSSAIEVAVLSQTNNVCVCLARHYSSVHECYNAGVGEVEP